MLQVPQSVNGGTTRTTTLNNNATDPVAPSFTKVPKIWGPRKGVNTRRALLKADRFVVDTTPTTVKTWGPRKEVNTSKRRALLESDRFAADITATTVKCTACTKTIEMDEGPTYYPIDWMKHCQECKEQARVLKRRAKVIVIQLSVWAIQGMI
jgi:hypothetical protein